ncbi:hypothetical protein N0M98_28145 [Paenibacillus doosanensis]|uniref:hypothetical protein n=1 Tax=Paenibacillus doosanensis TaxID=1229154 RepID=UPI00217FFC78|nr:hypothetical protein [Paenibacillus doosanensis]MCS7463986.1 hypothetical protein [Paenibacillus doosanensis]
MTIDHHRMLLKELERWHPDYNPELQMVRRPFSSPGYHTTLKREQVTHTHPTLAALVYALGLLDSEDEALAARASDIIGKVIGLQDQNRENATFGIWSWFLEEPLSMMAPPDWNWADFCGKRLVLAEQRHGQRFSAELRERLRHAVYCACDAIMKRNVGPGYTNIAIMGAFVTLIAGEVYGEERYRDYGLERLRKFSDYTKELGTFQEFNSPTYTVVAIQELSSIHTSTGLEEAKRLSADMLDVAWRMAAEHYHVPTGEWSGPHSRSYSTATTDAVRSFLELACPGSLSLLPEERFAYNLDWYGSGIRCPEAYISAFRQAQTGEFRQVVQRSAAGEPVNTATTYKDERISLGTFSRDVMWNQRRNLLAYVPNGEGFTYMHLRFLHDGYDYSSAVFYGEQLQNDVLFGIGFCTDGGDTHIGLDPIDGTIEASDLRLRLEFGGSQEGVAADLTDAWSEAAAEAGTALEAASGSAAATRGGADLRTANVRLDRGLAVQAQVLFAAFDGERPEWKISADEGKLCVDYVIYAGARKRFDFRGMEQALLVFALRLGSAAEPAGLNASAVPERAAAAVSASAERKPEGPGAAAPEAAEAAERRPRVHAEWHTDGGGTLRLSLPLKPAPKQEMLQP